MKSKSKMIGITFDEQLQNCINSGAIVQVYLQGDFVNEGQITSFCDDAILIGNEFYFRMYFSFFTTQKYFRVPK
jgi:hypothetical protein